MIVAEEQFKNELLTSDESEEVINKEFDESESYLDKWRVLESKLASITIHREKSSVADTSVSQNVVLRYPKLKLPTFNGDIKNWLGFWGQFKKIDSDPNLDEHDKFSYLLQSMEKGSSAEELIRSFPPGGESYQNALQQLQARFGKEDLLIEVYVRDLLSLVLQKNTSQKYSLRKLYDSLESKLRSLQILGVVRDKYAAMLYPLVESALPDDTLRAWQRFRSVHRKHRDNGDVQNESEGERESTHRADLDGLLLFLLDEIEGEERVAIANKCFFVNQPSKHFNVKRTSFRVPTSGSSTPSASTLMTLRENQNICIFCAKSHESSDCHKARKMSLEERESAVLRNQCCFLCLGKHFIAKCRKRSSCILCGKRHHILLCRNVNGAVKQQNVSTFREEESKEILQPKEALANISTTPNVLLPTLIVTLRGHRKKRQARAIIDSASQRSYVSKSAAAEMQFKKTGTEKLRHSLFGGSCTEVTEHDVYEVELSTDNGSYCCVFKALGQETICESIPPIGHGEWIKELENCGISLADQQGGPIEVLIGADIAGKLMTGEFKWLSSGLTAIQTKLGWSIMGKNATTDTSQNAALMVTSMLTKDAMISDLWALDSLGIMDPSEKKSREELHKASREHFLRTVQCSEDGRYLVSLPWLDDHLPLPDNFDLALKRLNSTINRLESEKIYDEYAKVFEEWERDGIIEKVPASEVNSANCHYLPHRPVVKENSTTKIRPVFDASAKKKGAPSLNDCLEIGLNLIELIPSILTRFRKNRIGVTADIRKAFLQIELYESDRNYLRFLWYGKDKQLQYYRHRRVVFGVSSSPFLLGSVIQYHLESTIHEIENGTSKYPYEMIQQMINSFYVDNCLTSVKSEEELENFIHTATEVMAEKKFDLRSWEFTKESDCIPSPVNVLGMVWEKCSDTLIVNLPDSVKVISKTITKRMILSSAHKVFDPLGICCPVLLLPKLLLQRLWKSKIGWDEEVDSETEVEFKKWLHDLDHMKDVRVSRWLRCDVGNKNISIHFFCDASKVAYSAAAFVRVQCQNVTYVQLIQARTRISPSGKKETTIARLELLGATILARLSVEVLKEFETKEVYYWTDSTTVLAWIRREETWGVFVHNRICEIRKLTPIKAWRYVPGSLNPADLPSRGCSARQLCNIKWWEGPSWLQLPREKWPNEENNADEDEILSEKKTKIVSSMINVQTVDLICDRISSYLHRMNLWITKYLILSLQPVLAELSNTKPIEFVTILNMSSNSGLPPRENFFTTVFCEVKFYFNSQGGSMLPKQPNLV